MKPDRVRKYKAGSYEKAETNADLRPFWRSFGHPMPSTSPHQQFIFQRDLLEIRHQRQLDRKNDAVGRFDQRTQTSKLNPS